MSDEDDDLFGAAKPKSEQISLRTSDVHSVVQGVSVPWMMKAFRMGRGAVEKRLAGCPTVGQGKHGTPIYDLPLAASYLVKPRIDWIEALKTLKPDELPEKLRAAYWDAKLKRQRWEEKAGDLWRTVAVLETFGEVFKLLRTSLQLIPEAVDRETGITPEQRTIITRVVDEIQDEMHKSLIRFASQNMTNNMAAEEADEDEDLI
jgi:hypothetical protein